jgi:hypothetical protein
MVLMARIELAHPCGYRILSPVRLPISPHEHVVILLIAIVFKEQALLARFEERP